MTAWTRIRSNRSIGQYEIKTAVATLNREPEWAPELPRDPAEGLQLDVIDSPDHPALLRLAGRL